MSVEPAYVICASFVDERFQIGDAQFLHVTAAAAELYGEDNPHNLVGDYLSNRQLEPWRLFGRYNYTLHKHGKPTQTEYCSVVRAPDGELLGQLRRTVRLAETDGKETWLVELQKTTSPEEPKLPDLEAHGLSEADCNATCGLYTFAQMESMLYHGTFPLQTRQNLPMILAECDWIASNIFSAPAQSGFKLMLNRSLCNWSTAYDPETADPVVQIRATCQACGWQWWLRNPRTASWRCPYQNCRAYQEVA